MNLGGRSCRELRLHHCTPAWATRVKLCYKRKKERREREKEERKEKERKKERKKKERKKKKEEINK